MCETCHTYLHEFPGVLIVEREREREKERKKEREKESARKREICMSHVTCTCMKERERKIEICMSHVACTCMNFAVLSALRERLQEEKTRDVT